MIRLPKPGSKRTIAAAFAVGVLAFVVVYISISSGASAKKETKRQAQPVTAATAIIKPMPVQISTIGHVQPIASVAIKSRIDGQIASVAVADGQEVKVGDTLFTLDDRQAKAQLDEAKANLVRDQAQLAFAEHEAVRYGRLAKQNAVSKEQMQQAEANAAALQGTVAADQAQITADQVQLSYTDITAPITGRLGTIEEKQGNTVQQSGATPLATINQMSPIYVAFTVPEGDVSRLRQAMKAGPVGVAATASGAGSPIVSGTLSYIDNAIDQTTGTLSARASFANKDEALWPGQFVNVVVTLRVQPNALVVPSTAVQSGQAGPYVLVITKQSTIAIRQVSVDRVIGNETVIAKGLQAGDRVVTSGQLRLTPGAPVAVQGTGASAAQSDSTS